MNFYRSKFAVASAPILALAALALFILREPILLGKSIMVTDITRYAPWGDGKGQYHDNPACANQLFEVYPEKFYYRENLLKGRLPAWESKLMGGYPVEGDPRFGWFDPFNLIFLVLNVEPGLKLLAFLQLFLIGVFSYGYLRDAKCRRIAAWFGGSAAMMSTFVITHIPDPPAIQSVMWFPFLLWMFERTCRSERFWPYPAIIAIGTALSILGGEPRMYIPMLAAFALYATGRILFPGAWECLESKPRQFSKLVIGLILGILLTMPQVLPTWQLGRQTFNPIESQKYSGLTFGGLSLAINPFFFSPPEGYTHMIVDYFETMQTSSYPGWILFLLFILALRFRYRDRRVTNLATLCVISWIFYYLTWQSVRPYWMESFGYLKIPHGALFIFSAGISLVAGFGLEELFSEITGPRRRFAEWFPVLTLFVLSILLLFLFHFKETTFLHILWACLMLGGSILIYIISKWGSRRWILLVLVLIISFVDSLIFGNRFLTFQKQGYQETPPPAMNWLINNAAEKGIFLGYYQLFLLPFNYPFIYGLSVVNTQWSPGMERPTNFWREIGSCRSPKCESFLGFLKSPLLNAAGVHCIVLREKLGQDAIDTGWDLKFSNGIYIYENQKTYPPSWIASQASSLHDQKAALTAISTKSFDPSKVVIIEGDEPGYTKGGPGKVVVKKLASGDAVFDVDAPDGGWLVFSETWYPGWEAEIDGEATVLYKADVAFMAVALDPGRREVAFRYRSNLRKIGYHISAVAAYILIMGTLWGIKRRRGV